ncbi:MAG: hypothetical protein NT067_06280 [Candidatus Diapherotrites archaeon]|nr:hypothetical protein [Candidatus Diapherotrites archaeon]
MKAKIALACALLAMLFLFFSGCGQPNVCVSSDECAGFKCGLQCGQGQVLEKACAGGKCECRCVQAGSECSTDSDCEKAKECGLPPNKVSCRNGFCKCGFECTDEEDCSSFQCLLDCPRSYNICASGACSCNCESKQKEYIPWEAKELRDELAGKIIIVNGRAEAGLARCTLMACTAQEPCCNSCSAGLELASTEEGKTDSIEIRGSYKGLEPACSGNECNIKCSPLEAGNIYSVTGLWKKEETSEGAKYYLEIIKFALLEESVPEIKPEKTEYAQGEPIKFGVEFGRAAFLQAWAKPKIQKKEGEQWQEFDSECGCIKECGKESGTCEENFPECPAKEGCSDARQGGWQWNQEYCELKEIACQWSTPGSQEKVYCGSATKAGPGTYRIAFQYVEDCSAITRLTAYSDEFTIK